MASRAVELKKAKSTSVAGTQERGSSKVQRRQTANEFDRNKPVEPQRTGVIARLFKQFKEPTDTHKDKHSSKSKKSRPLSLELSAESVDKAFRDVTKTATLAIETSPLTKSKAEDDILAPSSHADYSMNRWRSVGNLIVTQVVPEEITEALTTSEDEDENPDGAADVTDSSIDEETRKQIYNELAKHDEEISDKILQNDVLLKKLSCISSSSTSVAEIPNQSSSTPISYKSPLKELTHSCCVDADRITSLINGHIQPDLYFQNESSSTPDTSQMSPIKSEASAELLHLGRRIHESLTQLLMLYDNSPKINQVTICSYPAEVRSTITRSCVPHLFVSPSSSSDDQITWDTLDRKLSVSTSDSSPSHIAEELHPAQPDVFAQTDDTSINQTIPVVETPPPAAVSQSTPDDVCSVH